VCLFLSILIFCSTHGRNEKCVQKFGWKTPREGTTRPRRRWEDNIRMILKEVGWEGVGGLDASGSG